MPFSLSPERQRLLSSIAVCLRYRPAHRERLLFCRRTTIPHRNRSTFMPLYEYQCDDVGDVFETMQKFADEPLKVHDACGGAVHRLLSAPALQFKGSGWYITDYAKNSSNGK